MALVILEGLDRTGKSTVAAYYNSLGYELIHLSAPPKNMSADQYLQEMVDLITSASTKDIVLDRSHYGELIWPQIYGRKAILSEDDIEVIREIEDSVGVHRVLMYDPDLESHWQRCVENQEPLTKAQFVKARSLYSQLSSKYGFEMITLPKFIKQFPAAAEFNKPKTTTVQVTVSGENISQVALEEDADSISTTDIKYPQKTPEQIKLEKANAINEILSKRILKSKGSAYDVLENDIRDFLNKKLATLLGSQVDSSLTSEEIKFLKAMYKRVLEKGDMR